MGADINHLFTEWDGALRGYVARRLRDAHAVDDVVQETWMRIHRGLPGLRDDARVAPWIFRIARSALVDHVRRRRPVVDPADAVPLAGTTETDESVAAEIAGCLPGMLQGLSEQDRRVLLAVDVEGRSQAVFARDEGISAPTARSRAQRARRRLRAQLESCCRVEQDRRGNPIDLIPRGGPDPCGSC